jgi:hypothetical protein
VLPGRSALHHTPHRIAASVVVQVRLLNRGPGNCSNRLPRRGPWGMVLASCPHVRALRQG